MRSLRFLFFLTLCFFGVNGLHAQRVYTIKKALAGEWQVYQNDRYEPFTDKKHIHTIYFSIDANKFSGDYLAIHSAQEFAVFVNGKLATGTGSRLSIDSLAKNFATSSLQIAVHLKNISSKALQTNIETPVSKVLSSNDPINKPPTFLRDFVVVASLILLVILVVLVKLNPKLAADYFSVTRIFSLREADDSQIYTRIANSTNILFYVFCSLILGFYLVIIFQYVSPAYAMASYSQATTFYSAIAQWLTISLIILIVFFLKIVLVYITAILFGSKEIAGIHFFNWVRLLLIVFSAMSAVLYFYFILYGQNIAFHHLLLNLIAWCLTGWVIIIFLKLRGRSSYSIFHLFSYICATEIIPLFVIITVLYN